MERYNARPVADPPRSFPLWGVGEINPAKSFLEVLPGLVL